MPNFSVTKIRDMMDEATLIRNMSVIAHVDHGKSTLTDSLIGKAGIIADSRMGEARFMDTRDDEQARSITIKSTCVSLYYDRPQPDGTKQPYLINLIDSPGHVDFSSEVTAALRVTDGALVVVDCVEGVCVQTETVLRQAISERIKAVLFLNKLDRVFLELSCTEEEAYCNFRNSVESVNVIVETYKDEVLGSIACDPADGRVGFGSGLHAWGFTLREFAHFYSNKFGISYEKMKSKLWGDNYWDNEAKKWVKGKAGREKKLARGFCQFVLKPINTMIKAVMDGKKEVWKPALVAMGVKMSKKDLDQPRDKDIMKAVMRTWLPAGDALLGMIVDYLPSPAVAQRYRTENLYTGPKDSAEAKYLMECDKDAPMSMYVSKMVPTSDKGRFIAFGRVFSGTVKAGKEVRIMGSDFEFGKKRDLYVKKIQRVNLMMGRYIEQLTDCPAGNMCGLVGVDQYILKSGTVAESDTFWPFTTMKFSVSAVVRVAVSPKNASDLPKLVEGLKRLSKADPLVKCYTSKTGEHIIAGAGELHLEICLKDLQQDYLKGAGINVGEPVVQFCETMTCRTGKIDKKGTFPDMCVSKSPNKHNRLYVWGEPLAAKLVKEIAEGEEIVQHATNSDMIKQRARYLADNYGWDANVARKIWTYGCPPDAVPNMVVDASKAVQFLHEIKDHVVGAFMQLSMGGPLCDENLQGTKFCIDDVTLHADAIHRGAGQIMPCCKKVLKAVLLASGPGLFEPMYIVDIIVPQLAISGVYNTLSTRRGEVQTMEQRIGTPLTQIVAHLPVKESFGFTELLRKNTGGQAFPQMKFSHWQAVSGDPFKEGTMCNEIVMAVRKRKNMKMELPDFKDFYDKI